jgi:hypothetical protein
MKNRYIFLLFLSFLVASFTYGQPQLTFRFANPRTMRYSGTDYFEFDIQVMASTGGTYLWSGQAVLTFDNTTLSQTKTDWVLVSKGPLLAGTNTSMGDPKYSCVKDVNGTAPNMTAIVTWEGDINVEGNGPNSDDFNEITTSYQTLVTFRAKITSTTGVAGISFIQASMDPQQFYISAPNTFLNYYNPNLYDSRDFLTTYVGRVYCTTKGWSQVGNTSDAQWVHWETAVNTSVWDTTGGTAALIASTVTDGKAGALRIHQGAALNIDAGAALTCSGATEINERCGLHISAGSSSMGQFIDNGTITYNGSATAQVQCYLVHDQWHYYTIPITTTFARPYAMKFMKYYQEPTDHWKYVVALDSTLNTSMLGYAMWASSTGPYTTDNYVKPSGTLNTGTKSINLTFTSGAGNQGWNLIGNPYPSAIDLTSSGVTWGNTFTTLYFWDGAAGNYNKTYLKAGGGLHSQYVPPQQGFFIYCNSGTTTFGLDNTTRVINAEAFLKDAIPDRLILTAASSINSYYDESVIRFTPEASSSFDPYYDAFKLWGNYDAPQLYSIVTADTILNVNALKWIDNAQVVPMGFSCGLDGHYSILASNMETFQPNVSIYIEDIRDNIWQDLRANPTYNFSYSTTNNANRFRIHFSRPNDGVGNNNFAGMQIYSFEDYVYVRNLEKGTTKGEIQIYDLIGRKVFQAMLKDMELNKFLPGVNEGYYMVNVITDNNSFTRKVYLK